MENFLPFMILCYGLSHIITESELLSGVRYFVAARSRWLGYLLRCQVCCGFWIGVLVAFLLPSMISEMFIFPYRALFCVAGGGMASGFIALAQRFERQ